MSTPRWDPVAGQGMSPHDEKLVAVIAQSIRDSGHPHGTACTFPADPCTCQWERGSLTMARNVIKAIVGHLAGANEYEAER